MKITRTNHTLRPSLSILAGALAAVTVLGADAGAQTGAKAQAAKLTAPLASAPHLGPDADAVPGGKLTVPPQPTFEGDIVRDESEPGPDLSAGADGISAGQFRIALLDAALVTWVAAPSQIALNLGDRLLLEVADGRDHLVTWSGATPISITNNASRAEFIATAPGVQLVQATLVTPMGQLLGVSRIVVAVDAAVASGGSGPSLGRPKAGVTPACRLSAAEIVPGITATFIAVVPICNMSTGPLSLSFELASTAPAGMSWISQAPDDLDLSVGECQTVYVAFSMSDIDVAPDGGTDGADDHATLSLTASTGVAGQAGCSVQLLDVCVSCLED